MSRLNKVLFCLIGLMLAGLVAGLVGYNRLGKQPDALVSVLPKGKDLSLNHIYHVATRDGVKEWILDADSAQYQRSENKMVMKDVSATFFLKDGKTIHLTSHKGVLFNDTRDMEVSGDVVVRNGQHELKTERLYYDHKTRSVSTDTRFVFKGEVFQLTGQSMTFCFDTEQVLVKGEVEAVFESWRL